MAVIGRCESGFLVDHKKSITESVSPLSLSCKETLFALYEPYFRSSTENSCEPNRTRKRKVIDFKINTTSVIKLWSIPWKLTFVFLRSERNLLKFLVLRRNQRLFFTITRYTSFQQQSRLSSSLFSFTLSSTSCNLELTIW